MFIKHKEDKEKWKYPIPQKLDLTHHYSRRKLCPPCLCELRKHSNGRPPSSPNLPGALGRWCQTVTRPNRENTSRKVDQIHARLEWESLVRWGLSDGPGNNVEQIGRPIKWKNIFKIKNFLKLKKKEFSGWFTSAPPPSSPYVTNLWNKCFEC